MRRVKYWILPIVLVLGVLSVAAGCGADSGRGNSPDSLSDVTAVPTPDPAETGPATARPLPTGNAFEIDGTETGKKNTDSAGGILMILIFLVCLGFVIEAIVRFLFKAKQGHDDRVR